MKPIPLLRRIASRIFIAFLLVTLLAVFITSLAQYTLSSNLMRENVAQRNLQIARRAAGQIDQYMDDSMNDLRSIADWMLAMRGRWERDVMLENIAASHHKFKSLYPE